VDSRRSHVKATPSWGRLATWLAACLLFVAPPVARAHPAPFSFLDLHLDAAGTHGSLVVHDLDVAHDLGITPPEALMEPARARQALAPLADLLLRRLALTLDERPVAINWTAVEVVPDRQSLRLTFATAATKPARARIDALIFPYDPVHQTFINVYEDGALRHQAILDASRTRLDYYTGTAQGRLAVVETFVPAGIEHILIGPDHVLFLVGLLLLGGSLWRLAAIVTAFTIGHSITLSLAALDIYSPSSAIVEPLIALTIIVVGADNLLVMRSRRKPETATGWDATRAAGDPVPPSGRPGPADLRPWLAGAFGLIHGFGFAFVLKEFGLPRGALGWSLFSFNVGVEVGQLAIVIAVSGALAALARRSAGLAARLALAGSFGVILAGLYWFVERVFFPGGLA
jgi:hypothetical protein